MLASAAGSGLDSGCRWKQRGGIERRIMKMLKTRMLTLAALCALTNAGLAADDLAKNFSAPPDSARPGVYWYFMDGNQDRAAMTADLEAMHQAGLRKALFLEVNIGVPRGPVDFMSEPWQENFAQTVRTVPVPANAQRFYRIGVRLP